jgi:hypothetical protein
VPPNHCSTAEPCHTIPQPQNHTINPSTALTGVSECVDDLSHECRQDLLQCAGSVHHNRLPTAATHDETAVSISSSAQRNAQVGHARPAQQTTQAAHRETRQQPMCRTHAVEQHMIVFVYHATKVGLHCESRHAITIALLNPTPFSNSHVQSCVAHHILHITSCQVQLGQHLQGTS